MNQELYSSSSMQRRKQRLPAAINGEDVNEGLKYGD